MDSKLDLSKLEYLPKIATALVFVVLLGLAVFVFLGRKVVWARPDFVLALAPNFYQHVSNFSISYILVSSIGYIWLLMGVPMRYITGLVIFAAAVNFAYELWIPVLNTPDVTDAYYGLAGVAVAFSFLWFSKQFGLKENRLQESS